MAASGYRPVPCFYPLEAFQLSEGEIVFAERSKDVVRVLTLPCGRCIGCRLERSRQWAVRCMHEAQMHEESSFVTLTYDDDHVQPSLEYRDFQLFMKRLRKAVGPVRFFMCGEYGEKHWRPHFHACIFGYAFRDDRVCHAKLPSGSELYRSPFLSRLWPAGFASVGELTFDSAAYVARYCVKKVLGPAAADHYRRVDGETGEVFDLDPEFSHMSLKPGIGATWFDRFRSDVFENDYCIVNGMKVRPPKYYSRLLKEADPESFDAVNCGRYRKSLDFDSGDSTYERLRVREVVTRARLALKFRSLE